MTLRDVIIRLDEFEDEETIFAESTTPHGSPRERLLAIEKRGRLLPDPAERAPC